MDSNLFSGSHISPEKLKSVDFVSSFNPLLLSRSPQTQMCDILAELKTEMSDWISQFWICQSWGQKIKLSVYMYGFLNFQLYSFQFWEEKNELSDKISQVWFFNAKFIISDRSFTPFIDAVLHCHLFLLRECWPKVSYYIVSLFIRTTFITWSKTNQFQIVLNMNMNSLYSSSQYLHLVKSNSIALLV